MSAHTDFDDSWPADDLEAFRELCSMAKRGAAELPSETLASHVVTICEGADWPVLRAAMEALLRRWGFARRDELRLCERPAQGKTFGRYATRRKGQRSGKRPYSTRLYAADPPHGSCDCPDFLKGSLGLCKHLLVVLQHVHSKPTRRKAALAEQQSRKNPTLPTLLWNPIRPLSGPADLLLGVRFIDVPVRGGASKSPRSPKTVALKAAAKLRPWIDSSTSEPTVHELPLFAALGNGYRRLASTHTDNLKKRERLLSDLGLLARHGDPDWRDPALLALVEQEQERLARSKHGQALAAKGLQSLRGFKRKLYPYQEEGVRKALSTTRLLLADDMGLGKTTQAIATCHALYKQGKVQRGLIIVPAALKLQWLQEWQSCTDTPAAVVEGTRADRLETYRKHKKGFLIINYELLLRDLVPIQRLRSEMVVLDEAQRIKNWATKTAAYVKSLEPTFRLVLTGTPMENRLEELASLLDWVDDQALAPKWRLVPWHTFSTSAAGTHHSGARNLATLRERLRPCTERRVRQDILTQLPARTDTRVPVEMTREQMAEHDELSGPIAQLAQMARRRPLRQPEFLRLMQMLTTQRIISNGLGQLRYDSLGQALAGSRPTDVLDSLFAPKLEELRQLVTQLVVEQRRKVVIFSQWRRMLKLSAWAISDILEEAKQRAVFFTGAESQRQRTQSVIELHDDPATSVLFLSDAGGVGLNLQRAASACINLEMPWNPAVLEQRIGRIYRLGQTQPINVYNLISEYGIETRIATQVANKQALFGSIFDGVSNEVRFDGESSFVSQLEQILDPVEVPAAPESRDDEQVDALEDDPELETLLLQADESEVPAGPAAASAPSAEPKPATGAPRSPSENASAQQLFAGVTLHHTSQGGIRLEAEPQAASTLIAMFEGMAQMLRQATTSSPE